MAVSPLAQTLLASQVSDLVDTPGILLLDIRPRRLYQRGHVPGSQSIPSGLLLAGEVPDGDLVLIGQNTQHSAAVIEELHDQGYTRRISYLVGGFASWQSSTHTSHQTPFKGLVRDPQQLIGGPALVLAAVVTQSLALLGLGVVVLLGPWAISRSRA